MVATFDHTAGYVRHPLIEEALAGTSTQAQLLKRTVIPPAQVAKLLLDQLEYLR